MMAFYRPAQGLLVITMNIQVQCPVLLWVWLQFELVRDDPRNTVLMMPPLLSHILWGEETGEENRKLANTGLLGYRDD